MTMRLKGVLLVLLLAYISVLHAESSLPTTMQLIEANTTRIIEGAEPVLNYNTELMLKITVENPTDTWLSVGPLRYDIALYKDSLILCKGRFSPAACYCELCNANIAVSDKGKLVPPHSRIEYYILLPNYNNLNPEDRIGKWQIKAEILHFDVPDGETKAVTCPFSRDCDYNGNLVPDSVQFSVARSPQVDWIGLVVDNFWVRAFTALALIWGVLELIIKRVLGFDVLGKSRVVIGRYMINTGFVLSGEKEKAEEYKKIMQKPDCETCSDTGKIKCTNLYCKGGYVPPSGGHSVAPEKGFEERNGERYYCMRLTFNNDGGSGRVYAAITLRHRLYGVSMPEYTTEERDVVAGGNADFGRVCIPLDKEKFEDLKKRLGGREPKWAEFEPIINVKVVNPGHKCDICKGTGWQVCHYCKGVKPQKK